MSRRRKGEAVSGWINLDKPYDLGSTQAVSRVRRAFNAQKAGHAGTLDPLATGVLPIALGEATKTVPFLMDAEKTYRFTVRWGVETATFDREGAVTAESNVRPAPGEVAAALAGFIGEIQQIPPAYSAVKVDGERAYDLARAGETVTLEARAVTIHDLVLEETPDLDHSVLLMTCGKGAYVRAIARDLAEALGTRAHVSDLRRTRVGGFSDQSAMSLEKLEALCHTPASTGGAPSGRDRPGRHPGAGRDHRRRLPANAGTLRRSASPAGRNPEGGRWARPDRFRP